MDAFGGLVKVIMLLVKLAIVAVGVLIGTTIACFPMQLNPLMPSILHSFGTLASAACFGFGFLMLVFAKDWKVLKYSAPIGLIAPSAILGISLILLLIQYAISTSLWVFAIVGGPILYFLLTHNTAPKVKPKSIMSSPITSSMKTAPKASQQTQTSGIGAIEVVEFPEDYILSDEKTSVTSRLYEPFRNILRGMISIGFPVALRLERNNHQTRIYFLTWGSGSRLKQSLTFLSSMINGNLPKFGFRQIDNFTGVDIKPEMKGVTAYVLGEPLIVTDERQRPDPLTVVAHSLQQIQNGIVQIAVAPSSPSSIKRRWLTRQYKAKVEKTSVTVASHHKKFFSGVSEESVTSIDPKAARDAKRLQRKLQRYSAKHPCDVWVNTMCWDYDQNHAYHNANLLMNVLCGAIVPADEEQDLEIKLSKNNSQANNLAKGYVTGEPTLLLPEEATCYFVLPRCHVGIKTTKREAFSTATSPPPEPSKTPKQISKGTKPQRRGTVPCPLKPSYGNPRLKTCYLGVPFQANGTLQKGSLVWMKPDDLSEHLAIIGGTQTGKSHTSMSVVAQMNKSGISSLVLVPFKAWEWSNLRLIDSDVRIYTAGNPDIAPFRYNFWTPPKNVSLSKWMERIVQVMCAWMPNDLVMTMHFKRIVRKVYRNCGWDDEANKAGKPILLTDFYNAVEDVCNKLGYGEEVNRNFRGALFSRLESMLDNPKIVDMYNTPSGITIEELLEHTTIIDIEQLPEDDQTFFMGIITAAVSEYKLANPSTNIQNLLVLEEAHTLLANTTPHSEYGETARDVGVRSLIRLLRTAGGTGLGVVLIDQLPCSLAPEAMKLPGNMIIHKLGDDEERILVGRHAGCSQKQIDHIGLMRTGETVVHIAREGLPKNVMMLYLDNILQAPLFKKGLTHEQIKAVMKPVFESNPHLKEVKKLSSEELERFENIKDLKIQCVEVPDTTKNSESTESESSGSGSKVDSTLEHFIRTIVNTHEFAKMFFERLRKAARGDIKPLVNLILGLVKKFNPNEVDLWELARKTLEIVREELKAPEDDGLWNHILDSIRVELMT
jgi:hypothetical protein